MNISINPFTGAEEDFGIREFVNIKTLVIA
jgi:hypothetical protein